MNTREFLKLLIPGTGWIFTATQIPGSKGWINTSHQSLDDAVANINRLTYEHKAAYYAMATYEKEQVWDPTWVNPKTKETEGKWRHRTQANAMLMRSFFLDLDIDPEDPLKFANREQALREFKEFADRVGLSMPMVVDSGGGYHLYWPLTADVPAAEWRIVADQFKQICIREGFRADRSLTSDQARVLRALGGYNVRREAYVRLVRPAAPVTFADFKRRLDDYVLHHGFQLAVSRVPTAASLGGAAGNFDLPDNLGATSDPLNLDQIAFHCAQVGTQVGQRGAFAGEQLWRATLGIVKFCEPQDLALRATSDGHPQWNESEAIAKMDNWRTGPTTCAHFHQENPALCDACPHKDKLTSPAQLGKYIREAAPPKIEVVDETTGIVTAVELPKPPEKYKRRVTDGAILISTEDRDGNPSHEVICPYDLYPTRILRQSGGDSSVDERSMWRAHLAKLGPVDMELPQSLISDSRKLYAYLLAKGIYMSPDQSKATQIYMSAYLQKLAADADRDKLYDRMGWHESHREFVLGTQVIVGDGSSRPHQPSRSIRAVTKEGVVAAGNVDAWNHAMQFYNTEGMEGRRMFIYASFGAPLFHMNDTGNKGVLFTASGKSGRGKTTTLMAAASVWGNPHALLVNGNKDGATTNALYEALGTYHSLPFMWDDTTEREPDELRKFLLNISQGQGKMRMKDQGGISERRVQWETMVLASANTDDLSRLMTSGKDVDPHLMRLIGVEFGLLDTSARAKQRADMFLRAIGQNYGHAGVSMMKAVVQNYESIRRGYIKNIAKVDHLLNSTNASAERFWSAGIAAAYTGARVAQAVGLIPAFPVESDLLWMISHLSRQREQINENRQDAEEVFAEFLEKHISNTLVVSPKSGSNLDNIVNKPFGSLLIRHEPDNNAMWVSRAAIMEYCTEFKAPFSQIERALIDKGIITNRSGLKVLGSDTPYAKGQTRVWKIDCTKLGGVAASRLSLAVNNVTPMNGTTP